MIELTTTEHIDRTMCKRCGTWYWTGDEHECPVPGPTNQDVLDAAFPPHALMGRLPPMAAPCSDPTCMCRGWDG